MGIEPTYPAWKAGVLPLNYTRMCHYLTHEQLVLYMHTIQMSSIIFKRCQTLYTLQNITPWYILTPIVLKPANAGRTKVVRYTMGLINNSHNV